MFLVRPDFFTICALSHQVRRSEGFDDLLLGGGVLFQRQTDLSCGEVVFVSRLGGLACAGAQQAEANAECDELRSHGRIGKIRPAFNPSAGPVGCQKSTWDFPEILSN